MTERNRAFLACYGISPNGHRIGTFGLGVVPECRGLFTIFIDNRACSDSSTVGSEGSARVAERRRGLRRRHAHIPDSRCASSARIALPSQRTRHFSGRTRFVPGGQRLLTRSFAGIAESRRIFVFRFRLETRRQRVFAGRLRTVPESLRLFFCRLGEDADGRRKSFTCVTLIAGCK